MRDLDTILVSEMTKLEWDKFRSEWIESYANDLVVECDCPQDKAKLIAKIEFENYCGQEGYTARDEAIYNSRYSG